MALDPAVARSTGAMSALTLVSRLTGVVRITVAASVLGVTFLGNTYQSANTVPNLLFELFAAGTLQAALIPTLVQLLDSGDRRGAEHLAGSVLGVVSVALAALAGMGIFFAPAIMQLLTAGVEPSGVREAQIRLGVFLLWFFLPQVVPYAVAVVSTAVLNAQGRFAAPVFSPVLNNVVVTGAYLVFWRLRGGAPPSLDLTTAERLTLAVGTTLGVVVFCAVPLLAAVGSGFRMRPRLDLGHPAVREVARRGAWAGAHVGMTQLLLLVVLVLTNRVEGGVVAYQLAFTFFLLPHALVALPLATALYPRLSRAASGGDLTGFANHVAGGITSTAFFTLLASAAMVALAHPVASLALLGPAARAGADEVAAALAGLGPGLVGYGAFLLLTRAFYGLGDARLPALVHGGVTVGGAAAMAGGALLAGRGIGAVAAAHSAAYLGGSAVLLVLLSRRIPERLGAAVAGPVLVSLAAAVVAAVAMRAVTLALDGPPVVVVPVAGLVGAAGYLGLHRLLGRTIPVPPLLRRGAAR